MYWNLWNVWLVEISLNPELFTMVMVYNLI